MRLPKDTGEWTQRHLDTALAERLSAFERYEAKVDMNNREASENLYAAYLHKEEVANNVSLIVTGKPLRPLS